MVIVIFGKVLAGLVADPEASRVGVAPAMPVENAIETVAAIETPASAALIVSLVRMMVPLH